MYPRLSNHVAGSRCLTLAHYRSVSSCVVPPGSSGPRDPMGIVTTMDLADRPGTARYVAPSLGDVPLKLTLLLDGRAVDSVTITRRFVAPGVRTMAVDGQSGLAGTLFFPPASGRAPAVLVLGGSEGGNSARDVAAQLASRGYVTFSLAYFGEGSLPTAIDEIPLEYFDRAIAFLRAQPGVDSSAVGVFGSSKGAEAALLVATHDGRIRAVVAYAPSSVVWSCICSNASHSSWASGGTSVASVPPGRDPAYSPAQGEPLRPAVHYRYRLRDTAAVAKATIPVERIRGRLLIVAGDADELWPSGHMARLVRERRAVAGRSADDVTLIYPDAGHLIGKFYVPAGATRVGRIETGGSPPANAAAQADAWPRVLEFLSKSLGGR